MTIKEKALQECKEEAERAAINAAKTIIKGISDQQKIIAVAQKRIGELQKELISIEAIDYQIL